jgi:hypothetical protein
VVVEMVEKITAVHKDFKIAVPKMASFSEIAEV